MHLIGENLPADAVISWDLHDHGVRTNGTEATMTVPAGTSDGPIWVFVLGWPWGIFGTTEFTYDP
ncbi:hypothetical protein GCM10010435_68890 [Winogradskya consettensis]|uniref:Uncharacterized protein n=1 Tax=Winogradskya consettensis TaxID=113560 RepID=A0A919SLD4_9ACTN|nr:hypothetical protein [Actinoplanes consettensis]GIM73562.1 hypothetical protein Aco04nite_35890 [Actinoplanes consettensis]